MNPATKAKLSRFCKGVLIVFLVVIGSAAGLLCYMGVFNGNVRVVREGELYRSGQLRGRHLTQVLASDHIKSVVNLRGYSPNDPVLNYETSTSKRMGIEHRDLHFNACRLPEPAELQKLLHDFDTLPRPMLVHCAGGSDRSGLACVLYLNIYKNVPLDKALHDQLTWRYGHIPFGQAHPMDDFFALYRKTAHGEPIREWIAKSYPSIYSTCTAPQSNHARVSKASHGLVSKAANIK